MKKEKKWIIIILTMIALVVMAFDSFGQTRPKPTILDGPNCPRTALCVRI